MKRFSRIGPLVTSLLLVGACQQLIGLGKYEKVEDDGEGGGTATGGKGSGGSTGGKGGSAGTGTGGASGEAGANTGGSGGSGGSRGGRGGSTTGGNAGMSGEAGMAADGGSGGSTGGSGGSGGSTGGNAGASGTSGCTEITPEDAVSMSIDPPDPDFRSVVYNFALAEQLGSSLADLLDLQFYTGTSFDGDLTGTFDLGDGIDENFSTCARCVLVERDATTVGDPGNVRFYAQSGTLTVDDASLQMEGRPIANLHDVTLVEVSIDVDSYVSTPVANGRCLHIDDFSFQLPPSGWNCPDDTWGDAACTCGCGATDLECTGTAVGACDDCTQPGSCATDCSEVDLSNNAVCAAVSGWTCDPSAYGDGYCSCGCGAPDIDCADSASWACEVCDDPGTCSDYDCLNIDLAQNWSCDASSPWTCDATYYEALDGCDCGCGIVDPDCSSTDAADCDFCSGVGSCAGTCSDISTADNAHCG